MIDAPMESKVVAMVQALVEMAFRRSFEVDHGTDEATGTSDHLRRPVSTEPAVTAVVGAVRSLQVDPDEFADEAALVYDGLVDGGQDGAARELLAALCAIATEAPVSGLAMGLLLRARTTEDPLAVVADLEGFLRLIDESAAKDADGWDGSDGSDGAGEAGGADGAGEWVDPEEEELRAEAHALLGFAYDELGRHRDAVRSLDTAYGLAVDPEMKAAVATQLAVLYAYEDGAHSSEPREDLEEGLRFLAMPDVDDAEMKGDVERRIADAHVALGDVDRACEIWRRVHDAATEPGQRLLCAGELASACADAGRPVEAADWGWRLGGYWEETEGKLDPDDATDIIAMQYAAVQAQRAADIPPRESRAIWDRVLSRPEWWPQDATSCEIYGFAAQLAVLDNDLVSAHRHLDVAKAHLTGRSEEVRAELALTEAELAVNEIDLGTAERAVRAATPYIANHGDTEQRERLSRLVDHLDRSSRGFGTGNPAGDPVGGLPGGEIVAAVAETYRAFMSRHVDAPHLESVLQHALANAQFSEQGHLMVMAQGLRALVAATAGDLVRARTLFDVAREESRRLETAGLGGYPQVIDDMLGWMDAAIDLGRNLDERGLEKMDAAWRSTLARGRRALVSGQAAGAAFGWLSIGQPWRALPCAVAAITTGQEHSRVAGDSEDRAARRRQQGDVTALALRCAAATGDPRVMAEMLEVIRAQAMPVAAPAEPGWTGPFHAIYSALHGAAQLGAADLPGDGVIAGEVVSGGVAGEDREAAPALGGERTAYRQRGGPEEMGDEEDIAVRLEAVPLIRMPWGSIALGEWLVYDPRVPRSTATVQVGGSGIG